jgi:hypothetical protein
MRTETIAGVPQAAWEVEEIRSSRRNWEHNGQEEFEVKWVGFDDCTWEPADSFTGGGEKVLELFRKQSSKQHTAKKRDLRVVIEDTIDASEYKKWED